MNMKYYWIALSVTVMLLSAPALLESCQKYDEREQIRRAAARAVWEAKIEEMNMKGYYRECSWNTCQWRKDK